MQSAVELRTSWEGCCVCIPADTSLVWVPGWHTSTGFPIPSRVFSCPVTIAIAMALLLLTLIYQAIMLNIISHLVTCQYSIREQAGSPNTHLNIRRGESGG